MRRLVALVVVMLLTLAAKADAVTVRDLIELSHAGLSDDILIALIDVDHTVFPIDTATLKQLKQAGVSDAVILAVIRSGRAPAPAEQAAQPDAAQAQDVADSQDVAEPQPPVPVEAQPPLAPVTVPVPVAVPVAVAVPVPVPVYPRHETEYVKTTIRTDDGGEVTAKVPLPPNCTKAEPVYWGFGGKLRPNSWEPPATVVCR